MKKAVLIFLFLTNFLHTAEQSGRVPREWMPEEYAQGNTYQIACFSHWLKKHNIPIEGKNIISFGCGTGEIEANIAQTAKSLHGIDASKNMINYARTTHAGTHNLSFEHCFAEDFKSSQAYDLAFASCCFHWFEDKPQALQAIANSLKSNGLFCANIETQSNPKSFSITVFEEIKRDIPVIGSLLSMLPNPTGSSHPTYGDLHIMLTQAGLTNIQPKIESYDWKMTPAEWRKTQLPLLLSTPGAQMLVNSTSDNWYAKKASQAAFWLIKMSPEEKAEHDAPFMPESSHELIQKIRTNDFCRYVCNNFLKRCLNKLQKNDDGTYTWKYETTFILAQKK